MRSRCGACVHARDKCLSAQNENLAKRKNPLYGTLYILKIYLIERNMLEIYIIIVDCFLLSSWK